MSWISGSLIDLILIRVGRILDYRLNGRECPMSKMLLGYGLALAAIIALGFALGAEGTPMSKCSEKYGHVACMKMIPKSMQ